VTNLQHRRSLNKHVKRKSERKSDALWYLHNCSTSKRY